MEGMSKWSHPGGILREVGAHALTDVELSGHANPLSYQWEEYPRDGGGRAQGIRSSPWDG